MTTQLTIPASNWTGDILTIDVTRVSDYIQSFEFDGYKFALVQSPREPDVHTLHSPAWSRPLFSVIEYRGEFIGNSCGIEREADSAVACAVKLLANTL